MTITFYGGAGGVTGSKHLVELGGMRILLDCGLFQGHRLEAHRMNSKLPFDAKSIDACVLSHAHADHCGMLPILVREGFSGSIYATSATRDVAEWIMKDSAHIQVADIEYLEEHGVKLPPELQKPNYFPSDVPPAMQHMLVVPYARESGGTWTSLSPKVRLKMYDAGHILGSAITVLEGEEEGEFHRLVFTGDLGRPNTPLLRDPEIPLEEASVLIMESTYGGRLHRTVADAADQLIEIITRAAHQKSKIIVPAFSLGRTQELVYLLHDLTDQGRIPRIPIYVDSPLAANLTEVFKRHPEDYDDETWTEFGSRGEAPLAFRNLQYVSSLEHSKQLNTAAGPLMIISSSGMCEGGRVLHHLKHSLGNQNTVVLLTGYQAEHTLGRRLLEGDREVTIHDEHVNVRASIKTLNELSAHADQNELLAFAKGVKGVKHCFLVHGEGSQSHELREALNRELSRINVVIPQSNESFHIHKGL